MKRAGRQPIYLTAALTAALAAGFIADYPWGDWVGHTHWSRVAWIPFVMGPLTLRDLVQNLLLFSPVGAIAALRWDRDPHRRAAWLTLPVAVLGEWTQLYSHSRFPSATDVVCNLTGAVLGALLMAAWRHGHRHAQA